MSDTLKALEAANTIFISAQPDEPYFHWQVEIYLYQFAKHGIEDRCYALFGYKDAPSVTALEIAKKFKHVLFYKDERDRTGPNHYIPTIRPHLLKKFFAEYPELGASVFSHDSDIFLVRLPRFELMLADNINYVSDTVGYIGYNYINECQKRYTAKHSAAAEDPIVERMCACAGISVDLVKQNEVNSGGAQYLYKNTDAVFWAEVETLCQSLYICMKDYDAKYPIDHGIQVWTAGMWAEIWLVWKRGAETRIHSEIDFSWATQSVTDYFKKPIFHLAGVTLKNGEGKFYKGAYKNKNVFTEYARNNTLFDSISKTSATYEYVKILKEYADGHPIKEQTRFLLNSKDRWSAVYQKDPATVLGHPVWRSVDGGYIMFNNGNAWIITHTQPLEGITKGTGGYASTRQPEPYDGGWNQPCVISVL